MRIGRICDIAKYYGYAHQVSHMVQEPAELIVAITKENRLNIIDEVADTLIMIVQLMYFKRISAAEILKRIDYKIDRQEKKINSEKSGG